LNRFGQKSKSCILKSIWSPTALFQHISRLFLYQSIFLHFTFYLFFNVSFTALAKHSPLLFLKYVFLISNSVRYNLMMFHDLANWMLISWTATDTFYNLGIISNLVFITIDYRSGTIDKPHNHCGFIIISTLNLGRHCNIRIDGRAVNACALCAGDLEFKSGTDLSFIALQAVRHRFILYLDY